MKRKLTITWLYLVGWIFVGLGIIHNLATFVIYRTIAQLPADFQSPYILFFVATGTALIFAGATLIFTRRGLRARELWAWPIAQGSVTFVVLLGIGASLSMPTNPFALITCGIGLSAFVLLIRFRKLFGPYAQEVP